MDIFLKIKNLFQSEFNDLTKLFNISEFSLDKTDEYMKNDDLAMPGVYVFVKDELVIRIGRSLSNSRKRALEHIQDNTGGRMRQLGYDPKTTLMLFNVKSGDDLHWVASLEIFFELKLKPEIPSRIG